MSAYESSATELQTAMKEHSMSDVMPISLAARIRRTGRRACGGLLVIVAASLGVMSMAGPAQAEFGVQPDSFYADAFKQDDSVDPQAGGHPFRGTSAFNFNTLIEPGGQFVDENVKDITVSLPPGFVGNPLAVPRCPRHVFNDSAATNVSCPVESQVGTINVVIGAIPGQFLPFETLMPVFNIEPRTGKPADFAFMIAGVPTHLEPRLRHDGQYALDVDVINVTTQANLRDQTLTFWGVPGDPSHDGQRVCIADASVAGCETRPVAGPHKAFLTTPTRCDGNLERTDLAVSSWQDPTDVKRYTAFSQAALAGCESLPFLPSFHLAPDTTEPDAPTGLAVDLSFPQDGVSNPGALATAHLRTARVSLPEGLTINPAAAHGLQACTDVQLSLGTMESVECPAAARIGDAEATTPILTERLTGGVYIRSQASDDPASGEMFRIALVLENEDRGLLVKLPGQVRADPQTGRLEATFADNPQFPVADISLRFKGGPRAPLATPSSCGPKIVDVELTSWAGQTATPGDSFAIECPATGPAFSPGFDAGAVSPTGGAFSPFAVRIERDDRQQFLSGVSVDLPEGLLAKLRGVPLCGSEQATNGGCPTGSRIGTATVGAGPGSNPFYVKGDVFLTEGYKGGPYGLAVHVHAKAGPFDLGWVRVRQALYVDPVTAEVSVVSDPLPQIVKGVPVRLRDVRVDVDKPDFTVNPTSCSEQRVDATLTSINGAAHRTGSRFQVGDCAALPFKPRLGLRLTGRKQIRTGRHPGVRAVVRQSGIGEAAIGRARVVLPKSLALDPENAQALCEFDDGTKPDLENHCPKGSIVGRARAKTPLLDRDLVGDVYFVKNVRIDKKTGNEIRTLPMIVVALRGEIAINLTGKSSTAKNGRLINTFANVPDAPIGRFNLNINGGRNGILAVTRTRRAKINLCANPNSHIADTGWRGQNGKRSDYDVRVKTPCTKAATKAARKRGK